MRHQNGGLHGNLALQYDPESPNGNSHTRSADPRGARTRGTLGRAAAPQRVATAQPARPVIETIRIAADPAPRAISMVDERKHQIRRELTIRRIRDLFLILATVVVVSGIFGIMVWRQSRILADNFGNLAVERQIKRLEESSSQISENLAVRTELSQIRTQAVQRLGLQVPARSQIVPVVIPNTDRVVFNDKTKAAPGDESARLGLLFSLEGFFKTLDVKGSN